MEFKTEQSKKLSLLNFQVLKAAFLVVVYYDQLSGAVRAWKLVELLHMT